MIKALIVDDEALARRGIKVCLRDVSDVVIAGECSSGTEGIQLIRTTRPDLVFLDIKMGDMSGFEVLSQIDRREMPLVVFLTGYDEFALRAFDEHATDYILKPIDDKRFHEMLNRVRGRLREKHADSILARQGEKLSIPRDSEQFLSRFAVRIGRRVTLIDARSISWISAAGDYVTLHQGTRNFLIRDSLENLERQLDPRRFARIHRSTIVALDQIREIASLPSRDYELKLMDGSKLRASRRYRHRLRTGLAVDPR